MWFCYNKMLFITKNTKKLQKIHKDNFLPEAIEKYIR